MDNIEDGPLKSLPYAHAPDIMQETGSAAITFHSLNAKASKWMKQAVPIRYDVTKDVVKFEYPAEAVDAKNFRKRAELAGFQVQVQM